MGKFDELNPMQKLAVETTEGPVLVLAGAGSGKTKALTTRIAYLIEECQVNPWNILAITFTNKAAGEMKERVENLVTFGAESIWVSTFHSTCLRILRRHASFIGYDTDFTIFDTDDQKTLMKQVLKKLDFDPKLYKERAILGQISSLKNELINAEDYAASAPDFKSRKIAQVYLEYQASLKKNNAMDFDDLLMNTVLLFRTNPAVLDYYQERFRYILVDEYQDTNTAQFRMIELLAAKYKNLCVVGDDDQSIYKFRGANIQNILNFEKSYPGAAVIKLEQNYRSTAHILDAANEVIRNNYGRKDKKLWTEKEYGADVRFRQYDSAYEEAEEISKDIAQKVYKGAEYSDFAVLYRTNAQSRILEEKMMMRNVPYRLVGGVNFYQRKEIKDILAYLKTINSGRDDLSAQRIINVPKRGIGATSIGKIMTYSEANGISFYEACERAERIPGLGKAAAKVDRFVEFIRVMRSKMAYYSISDMIADIVNDTGYRDELMNDTDVEYETRIENIEELKNKAVSYENHNEASEEGVSLTGFLGEVSLVADIDRMEDSENRVTLMTLHSAKGLEFPRVYLAGMEEGVFPGMMSIHSDDPDAIEEERRLAYVGITRAKEELILTAARSRMSQGKNEYHPVSRFVDEIPPMMLVKDENTSVYSRGGYSSKAEPYSRAGQSYGRSRDSYGSPSFGGWRNGESEDYFDLHVPVKKPVSDGGSWKAPAAVNGAQNLMGKQFTVTKADKLEYEVGERVRHKKFGEGIVLEIKDAKKDFEVTVDFDSAGQKRMYAAFAKLEKIDS